MRYDPRQFLSLYKTPLGQRIWKFLSRPEIVERLITASELGKPAVQGIEVPLLEEFRRAVLDRRTKQMIGHMVRQIMEDQGWIVDRSDVVVRSVPFVKATRYRHPDRKTYYAFRNSTDPGDVAITDRRRDAKLPSGARWVYYVSFYTGLQAWIGFGVQDFVKLGAEVRRQGYKRVYVNRLSR